MEALKIPPKTIHNWRVRGVLVDEIHAAFDKWPEVSKGVFFPWFLRNQHIVSLTETWDMMMWRAWRSIGGSGSDSPQVIRATMARKSDEEQRCFSLYVYLFPGGIQPGPDVDLWLEFGFASCLSRAEESDLRVQYQFLFVQCTFDEFCDAYRARRLLDLFHSKGLQVNHSDHFRDLLRGPSGRKSVWLLKRFIAQGESAPQASSDIHPAVMLDYGFMNCKDDSERQELKRVYKAFFESHAGDPLALHEAAIKGNVHGFLSNVVQGLEDPTFQQLMKNPYPLPGL